MPLRLQPLLGCLGTVWVLSACATNQRSPHLGPDDVAGCYLVTVVAASAYRGLFPDTIALIHAPLSQVAGAYGTRITLERGRDSTVSFAWRMIGPDSLEIIGTAASFAIDVRGRLAADGFGGTVTFASADRSATGVVTSKRAYCLGF